MLAIVRALLVALMAATASLASSTADCNEWPAKPVRMIVPTGPGIRTDIVARMISDTTAHELKQSIYVENVPGVAGTLGTNAAARAAPDGYSMLFATLPMLSANGFLYKAVTLETIRALAPVLLVCRGTPFVLAANASIPVHNFPEFLAYARSKPDKLSYAIDVSSGIASLIGKLIAKRANIDFVQVPYRTTGQAAQDTAAGDTQFIVTTTTAIEGFVQSGKLRPIAVTSTERVPGMEHVSTVAESLPDFQFEGGYAIMAPNGTPTGAIETMNRAAAAALRKPELAQRLEQTGCSTIEAATPNATATFLEKERSRWQKIVPELEITPQ